MGLAPVVRRKRCQEPQLTIQIHISRRKNHKILADPLDRRLVYFSAAADTRYLARSSLEFLPVIRRAVVGGGAIAFAGEEGCARRTRTA